jgi:hypothetical protein
LWNSTLWNASQKALTSVNSTFGQKTLFIIPTDAHHYKSVEILKQFKVITLAQTCFGSRRNHHLGAFLCLAKTTDMVFFCARRFGLSQCYGGISACYAGVRPHRKKTISVV